MAYVEWLRKAAIVRLAAVALSMYVDSQFRRLHER